jgi:hypothetical protein
MDVFPLHLFEYLASFFDDDTLANFLKVNREWRSRHLFFWKSRFECCAFHVTYYLINPSELEK